MRLKCELYLLNTQGITLKVEVLEAKLQCATLNTKGETLNTKVSIPQTLGSKTSNMEGLNPKKFSGLKLKHKTLNPIPSILVFF